MSIKSSLPSGLRSFEGPVGEEDAVEGVCDWVGVAWEGHSGGGSAAIASAFQARQMTADAMVPDENIVM